MLVPATPRRKIRSAATFTIRSLVARPFGVSRDRSSTPPMYIAYCEVGLLAQIRFRVLPSFGSTQSPGWPGRRRCGRGAYKDVVDGGGECGAQRADVMGLTRTQPRSGSRRVCCGRTRCLLVQVYPF